jgi:putative membrane-bound dehydrogenase-like protein
MRTSLSFAVAIALVLAAGLNAAEPKPLKILWLGDNGHHKPAERYRQLAAALAPRKIDIVYTDKPDALNAKNLAGYDGLIVYANIDNIAADQETALLDFVAGGKGFIPLHCASYCFRNSPKYVELVGAQFLRHGTGTFRVSPAIKDHPITKGYGGFESWDETYVHTKHNEKDRTVLEYRVSGSDKEPWTWVRTHDKGRVFYTAWGHDDRTFSNPGFQNLVERGIRWACGDDPSTVPTFFDKPEMVGPSKDVKPFEFVDAKIPFYPPSRNWGTTAEPINKMQKPLEPNESMKHYQHPAGFEMKLFASEPNFGGKPIAMAWDERGRLWVAVTVDYPNNMQPTGQGNDKIVICEDTDGDGVADKFTVFADKLSIPTSLAFAYGGVIVTQAPNTLFLKASKGDDKCDVRTVLFSGWGTRDTHAGPSNLRYGPDGWYYGMCGYSGFRGTVGGEYVQFGQGFWRIKLDQDVKTGDVSVSKLEFLRGTNNNSWGVGFSEDGLLFGSTANGCASVYMPIPNRFYEKVRGWSSTVLQPIISSNKFYPITEKIRQVDWHGGFTAAAGHALYTARAYPREYWNRTAFVSDPTGHLTATFILEPKGTDFTARYGWNLFAGDEDWIAPIAADVGPDGNVWMIDWYNIIVQHNPTPPGFRTGKGAAYETELRDKKFGRVYRLVPKGQKTERFSLDKATDEQLVAALKNPTMLWRMHAQRMLVEKNAISAADQIAKLVEDKAVDGAGLNVGAIHALWTLDGLNALTTPAGGPRKALINGVSHPSAGVRMNAARVLPSNLVAEKLINCHELLTDPDPKVRLAALLKISEMDPKSDIAPEIVEALKRQENLDDRWLPDALTAAAAAHDLGFLKSLPSTKLPEKAYAIVATVAEHLARRAPAEGVDALIAGLPKADPRVTETIVAALAKGWPKGKLTKLSPEAEKALAELVAKFGAASKGQIVRLASAWGSTAFEKYSAEIVESLMKSLADDKASDDGRVTAAKQLVEFRATDAKVVDTVLDLITLRSSPAFSTGMIDAASGSSSPELGKALIKHYAEWPPSVRAAALRLLLAKPDATRALLDTFDAGTISMSELTLDQKQALAGHPDAAIAKRAKAILAKGGGLPNADRQKVIDELLPVVKQKGDPANGKEMFKKHCSACHQHSGEGTKIGPDLTGVAVHPKDHLIIDILDPSRSVEGNFRLYQVTLTNEKVLNGMLASETKTTVELIDSQAKRQVILREEIDSIKASNKSLMPEGFEKQMNPKELTDLLEFLTQRGKYLPIPLDKAATIVSTKGMFYSETAAGERMVFSDWKPKMVGEVPFVLVDPQGDKVKNAIMLYGPLGAVSKKMPKSATIAVNGPAKTIHLLSGVGGWAYPYANDKSVSMKVRLHYDDGQTEDHDLLNGEHFADYIRRVDVTGSKFAFSLSGKQIRYLTLTPKREAAIKEIEFIKGTDSTAPIVMAVTVEGK